MDQDSTRSSDHFENIQSTNWQTMRFKPPPPGNDSIGWRVEFRPMEVQPTDFENAAFSVFIVLLTRIILTYDLNFYMPISLVDENMHSAHRRDSLRTQLFHFPCDPYRDSTTKGEIAQLTINEIINGGAQFPGLANLIESYLDSMDIQSPSTRSRLDEYLKLIRMRACGDLITPASWMREFVSNHPEYKEDSVVGPEITYDMLVELDKIARQSQEMSEVDFCCHYSVGNKRKNC